MEVVEIKVADIRLPDWNPRYMPETEKAALRRSIEEYGFVEPVVVNRPTMEVLGGNQRVMVAREMGLDVVPAVIVELDVARAKALNVALNRIHGDWDMARLQALLAEIADDSTLLETTGFREDELEELLGEIAADEEDAAEAADLGTTLPMISNRETDDATDTSDDPFVSFRFGAYKDQVPRITYERFSASYAAWRMGAEAPVMGHFLEHLMESLSRTPENQDGGDHGDGSGDPEVSGSEATGKGARASRARRGARAPRSE